MQRDLTFFSDELKLAATLRLPESAALPAPGIVVCPGFGGVKELILPQIADRFAEAGLAVLRFDHRGFGQSEGPKWRLLPLEQVRDIRNAITCIAAQPEVDASKLGLYGTSFGGGNAVMAAALDVRPQAVVCCVPVGNGYRWMRLLRRNWEWIEFQRRVDVARTARVLTGEDIWLSSDDIMPPDPESHSWHQEVIQQFPERQYQLPMETAEAILEYQPEEYVSRIAPRPILFIGVHDDYLVPSDQTTSLYERAADPKGLLMLEDITHHDVYSGQPFDTVMRAASEWFARYLT